MKAILRIEAINHEVNREIDMVAGLFYACGLSSVYGEKPKKKYWAAKIVGIDPKYKFSREFLNPKKDYSKSNSKGSRGIYYTYLLDSKNIYDVSEPVSWKNVDRYFCKVSKEGDIIKITEDEVKQWLKENILE
jgi:hypothetical protein